MKYGLDEKNKKNRGTFSDPNLKQYHIWAHFKIHCIILDAY